ncbi:MAG: LptF/LptG family permease, partial [Bacteroidales bacterium]|nr:LptF/LptG family permease [Bacteroidales bacterium]
MKQIDRLILRSFIGPLVLTFLLAVFVLLMQFLWKYIDDMVGKGLDFLVIAQLLFYASATFVPMALPIATLFASIMTMGNFGEKYELIAMKAGGISIRRVMMPMAVVVLLLTGMAFYFANNIMPIAVLKYKMTLYDVTRKKPALNIKPSEYYSGIDGYVIRIDEKDKENKHLNNIIIYDHTDGMGNVSVTVA